jgi:hypothetical protein
VVIAGHALVQNIRRGHYELGVDQPVHLRVAIAFDELAMPSDGKTAAQAMGQARPAAGNATTPVQGLRP